MKWNTEIDLDKHNVWFTSDLHLFHENVILMNKRPFKDVYEMYEYFKNEWNSKVKPNDYVFILGDVLWGSQATRLESMVNTLNGNICIVLGNHDKEKTRDGVTGSNFDCFHSYGRAEFIRIKSALKGIDQLVYLSHYPALSWPNKGRGSIHLHGHVHGMMDDFNEASPDLRVDVGVDAKLGYMKLLSFEEIYEYFINKTKGVPLASYMQNLYNNKRTDVII